MFRRLTSVAVAGVLALSLSACHNKRVSNPIANVDSKQPDKVLFDRAMDMLKQNKFDQARLTLQTLINTYPDSEFVARAKLGVADSWYAEGGSAAMAQAEAEYKDFKTFFPNMPEAAEAQLKVANIHFQQMEKPDRDFTHAKRAEDEYRALIQEFPDSKLVPEAKQKLRMVQEVLAEREFRIGRFYYLRESYPAAIARLKSVADTYPLYSQAEEALFMIGDAYEQQIKNTRESKLNEAMKGKFIQEFTSEAANAYSRIITRYPVTGRAGDAKARLEALRRPVPTPTADAIAQNKAEEASRASLGMWGRTMLNFHRRPDMAQAAKIGEPTLNDPRPTNAPDIVKHVGDIAKGGGEASTAVGVETVGAGAQPGANQAAPRSDTPPSDGGGAAAPVNPAAGTSTTAPTDQDSPQNTGIGEITPMTSAPGTTANQTNPPQAQPTAQDQTGSNPAPPPQQVNQLDKQNGGASASSAETKPADGKSESSSKKNKKKRWPF